MSENVTTPVIRSKSLPKLSAEQFTHLKELPYDKGNDEIDKEAVDLYVINFQARFRAKVGRGDWNVPSIVFGIRRAISAKHEQVLQTVHDRLPKKDCDSFPAILSFVVIRLFTQDLRIVGNFGSSPAVREFSDERIAKKLYNLKADETLKFAEIKYLILSVRWMLLQVDVDIVDSSEQIEFWDSVDSLFTKACRDLNGKNLKFTFES